jgi:hypothetical protein
MQATSGLGSMMANQTGNSYQYQNTPMGQNPYMQQQPYMG